MGALFIGSAAYSKHLGMAHPREKALGVSVIWYLRPWGIRRDGTRRSSEGSSKSHGVFQPEGEREVTEAVIGVHV